MYLLYSSFSRPSKFSVRPEAINLDLFWIVFHEFLPQMRSTLYKIFTCDAKQGNRCVLGTYSVKYRPILLKFSPDVVLK